MANHHEPFLREAIALARQALLRGDGPYGALLVADGRVLLRAENTTRTDADRTRHAEMNLLVQAQRHLAADALARCTLYASTEPCAMCAGAIFHAGVRRVVFGCSVARQVRIRGGGLAIGAREVLESSGEPVEVVGPLLEDEAAAVLEEGARHHVG
jgi:tRNA(Arg) A34 adenosine deaminase TadA